MIVTWVLTQETLLRSLVLIIPPTSCLEIESNVFLVGIIGMSINPWTISESWAIWPGPVVIVILVASYPDLFCCQCWEEFVGEMVSNRGQCSVLSIRSHSLTIPFCFIPWLSSGEVLITTACMAIGSPSWCTSCQKYRCMRDLSHRAIGYCY